MIDLSRAFNRRARGGARRIGGGGSRIPGMVTQIRAAAFANWRADSYTLDGVSGNVLSWTELSTSATGIKSITANHVLTQATSAQQCAVPAANASFQNRVSATFVDQRYLSNSAASSWRFLHDGTGVAVYSVLSLDTVTGSKYLLATSSGGTGTGFNHGPVGAALACFVGNGTAAIANPSGGTLAISTAYYWRYRYTENVSPEVDVYIKTSSAATTASTSAAPAAGDAGSTLELGNRPANNAPFVGKWCETIIFKGAYDAALDALVKSYFTAYYGVV